MANSAQRAWPVSRRQVWSHRYQHQCVVFDTDARLQHSLSMFARDGLKCGLPTWFFSQPEIYERLLDDLAATGTSAVLLRDRIQLATSTLRTCDSPGGSFEPQRLLRWIARAVDDAISDGFAGCRIALDWTAYPTWQIEQLADFDKHVSVLGANQPLSVLCTYDRRQFGHLVDTLAEIHPESIRLAVAYHDDILTISPTTDGVRLTGEVDLSNRRALGRSLAAANTGQDMHLYLANLAFISITALEMFEQHAQHLHATGHRLILHNPSRTLRRVMHMLWPQRLPHGLSIHGMPRPMSRRTPRHGRVH